MKNTTWKSWVSRLKGVSFLFAPLLQANAAQQLWYSLSIDEKNNNGEMKTT